MSNKCEVMKGKQTNWFGLWWHAEYSGFSSASISLSKLKEFKGNVRLYVRKNSLFKKGGNRPNYLICIKDSQSPTFIETEVIEDEGEDVEKNPYIEDGTYYTGEGQRLYTYDEVQYAINRASEDGRKGYGAGDNLVEDYL